MIDVKEVRKDFPFFGATDLAYLDNSATSQNPKAVMDAEWQFYVDSNANPFRGIYELSERATNAYEHSRETVREFINAKSVKEVVFTRNASESLNLVAFTFADMVLEEGDEVLVSILEHHSNMLPWREAAKRKGATVKYLEVDLTGEVTPETVQKALTPKTKILAITQVSNIMGRENDIKAFAKLCHDNGTYIVCDGAQSVPHMPVDVQDLDVDFLAFSGHKMLAPMGVGVLYGKEEHFAAMPPFLTGGEMISTVSYDGMTLSELPHKFEAGTVNASGAVALEAAIEYIKGIGFEDIQARETALCKRILDGIKDIPHVTVLGSDKPEEHHGIVTFKVDGVHPHDISAIFADNNVAVRAGHHCAQPLHICLGIPSTTRASVMFYNTEEEVDRFLDVLSQIRGAMGYGD
ncbi:MAG: SufS family cysteine desulfurase [Clostridia bacterium]|nr:SufS family cysteine desulfurase [Clostridia bacterium]